MKISKKEEQQFRKQIIDTNRVCVESGLISSSDGNISVRVAEDYYLITASGLYKRKLKDKHILAVNSEGERLHGKSDLKPSSEMLMHMAAYRQRPDIRAVLHAHPPIATALTIAGLPFPNNIVPEIPALLGEVAIAAYATPGTTDLAASISGLIINHDAILLSNHGSLTVGKTLEQALINLERLELVAKMFYIAKTMGHIVPLPETEIFRLLKR